MQRAILAKNQVESAGTHVAVLGRISASDKRDCVEANRNWYKCSSVIESGEFCEMEIEVLPVQEDCTLTLNARVYYDLEAPTAGNAPLLIALHGYGANKRQMMREARQMVPDGFAIASVQGYTSI